MLKSSYINILTNIDKVGTLLKLRGLIWVHVVISSLVERRMVWIHLAINPLIVLTSTPYCHSQTTYKFIVDGCVTYTRQTWKELAPYSCKLEWVKPPTFS